ncbi:hypothetical protein [Haloprofundus marisrubri]|uniref:hypothetical protein n=1 Tax=Haloprofundus marisrubri TaxID=1514971 RepID=UPI0012BABF9A|nr:hypothetical protein [Haloprofundus marisrubri]
MTQTIGQQGRSWSKLASEVLGDYYDSVGVRAPNWEEKETQECPLCGEDGLTSSRA